MRRIVLLLILVGMLTGCASSQAEMDKIVVLRQKILSSDNCEFETVITADYGDRIYTFALSCKSDSLGNVEFRVISPETISDISGVISGESGKLNFDEQVLVFDTIADGQLSPVSAPWVFVHTLRGGYIKGCEKVAEGLHVQIDDSYAEDALQLDVWFNESLQPIRAEIIWAGTRVLTLDVSKFHIL